MFHFGGSSVSDIAAFKVISDMLGHLLTFQKQHTLIFRKGVNISGFPKAGASANIPVRSKLATVKKSSA